MRAFVLLGAVVVGCATAPPVQPPREPANLMSSEEFASRISGLRATLARNHVDIDTLAVIDSCAGDDYRHSMRNAACDAKWRRA